MLISLEDVEEVFVVVVVKRSAGPGKAERCGQRFTLVDGRDDATMSLSRLLSTIHSLLFSHMAYSKRYFFSWLPLYLGELPVSRVACHATDPASVADRWVGQLEEEAGAVCESGGWMSGASASASASASATGAAAGAGPGPSTLSSRPNRDLKAVS